MSNRNRWCVERRVSGRKWKKAQRRSYQNREGAVEELRATALFSGVSDLRLRNERTGQVVYLLDAPWVPAERTPCASELVPKG